MHRVHAIGLASLCCAIVAVVAACGSSSQVQYNYGSLANEICGKFTATTTSNPSTAARLRALDAALAGLQGLNPPKTVQTMFLDLIYHFKAAIDILKPNMQTLSRLGAYLQAHPGDKRSTRQYARITRRIQRHLQVAARDAHILALSRCETVFGG